MDVNSRRPIFTSVDVFHTMVEWTTISEFNKISILMVHNSEFEMIFMGPQLHQENSTRLERLAPDAPDATRLPYLVWRHNDGRDAIKFSCPRIQF